MSCSECHLAGQLGPRPCDCGTLVHVECLGKVRENAMFRYFCGHCQSHWSDVEPAALKEPWIAEQEMAVLRDAVNTAAMVLLYKKFQSLPLVYLLSVPPAIVVEQLLMTRRQRISTPTLWYALALDCFAAVGWTGFWLSAMAGYKVTASPLIKVYFAATTPIVADAMVRFVRRYFYSAEQQRHLLRGEWRRNQLGDGAQQLSRVAVLARAPEAILAGSMGVALAMPLAVFRHRVSPLAILRNPEIWKKADEMIFAEPSVGEHNGALRNLNARLSLFNWFPSEECSASWAWLGVAAAFAFYQNKS